MTEEKKIFDPSMFNSYEELVQNAPEEAENYMPLEEGGFVKKTALSLDEAGKENLEARHVSSRDEIANILKTNPEGLHAGFYDAQAHKFLVINSSVSQISRDENFTEDTALLRNSISDLAVSAGEKSRDLCENIKSGAIKNIGDLEIKLKEILDISRELRSKSVELLGTLTEDNLDMRRVITNLVKYSYLDIYENFYFAIAEMTGQNEIDLSDEIKSTVNPYLSVTSSNTPMTIDDRNFYSLFVYGEVRKGLFSEDRARFAEITKDINENYNGSLVGYLSDHGFSININIDDNVKINENVWSGVLKSKAVIDFLRTAMEDAASPETPGQFDGFIDFSVEGDQDNKVLVIQYKVKRNLGIEQNAHAEMIEKPVGLPKHGDEKWLPYSRQLVYDKIGKKYCEPLIPTIHEEDGKTIAEIKVAFV